MIHFDELPDNTMTMSQLLKQTGAMHETTRRKLLANNVRSIGKFGIGRHRSNVFNISDIQFMLDADWSKYKKIQTGVTKVASFDIKLANRFIREINLTHR